ncbi:hypothetical protein EDC91_14430 [Shewanella fodinae]|uniref:Uncharacterized protein n=1 Tax=Shewanella fodinae TaxID=552357 RepID=A0A4R2F148_9GAMM|nr:hypothetical protein EDC91_14430 [Shewanella fodinae]
MAVFIKRLALVVDAMRVIQPFQIITGRHLQQHLVALGNVFPELQIVVVKRDYQGSLTLDAQLIKGLC